MGASDGERGNLLEECLGIGPGYPIRKWRNSSSSVEYKMSEDWPNLKQLRTQYGQLLEVYMPLELGRYFFCV